MDERFQPSLNLVYLPHLDYNLQRLGPDLSLPAVREDLRQIDEIVGELAEYFEARGVGVIVLSEYGITSVEQPIYLNRAFRREGWLGIKDELGREVLDPGSCRVFAVADHQVAHIYVNDPRLADDAHEMARMRALIEREPGVGEVLDRTAQETRGLWHPRSGDFLAVADARSWFCYYYWEQDDAAPDFARTVDIHRKPGYDPVELFIDPALRLPAWRVGKFLLKKKLGLRALLEVIPLDAMLVRGSHGRVPEDSDDWPVFIQQGNADIANTAMSAEDVYSAILSSVLPM